MRPQVRGLRWMPCWARAAWMRNSPSSGFACKRRMAAIAFRSTLRAGWRGPRGRSANPGQPSRYRSTTAFRRATGSGMSRYRGSRRGGCRGRGSVARIRLTVWWLTGRSKRCSQIVAIWHRPSGGYSAFNSTMALRLPSGRVRRSGTGAVSDAKRLRMPATAKRATLRRRVRSGTPVSRARARTDCRNTTSGRSSS
jgi:hypothetical protein